MGCSRLGCLKLQLLVNVVAQAFVGLDAVAVGGSLGGMGSAIRHGVDRTLGRCVDAGNLNLGRQSKGLGNGADSLVSDLAVLGALSNTDESILTFLLPQQRSARESLVTVLEYDNTLPVRVRVSKLSKAVIELAAILLRNVLRLNVLLQHTLNLVATKDKDLGNSDRIEPALDPAPDSAEERRRADNEYAIQRLGVMRCGELRRSLHVLLQVPELLETDARDVDDVGAQRDGDFGVFAVEELGAEGHVEASQVLVESE